MCRIYTDDGRVVKQELDVLRSCLNNEELGKGFLMSSTNQVREVSDSSHTSWQILYEKSSLPVALRQDLNIKDLTKLIGQIYRDCREEAERQQYREALKNKFMDRILWVVAMPCTVALVWGVLTLLKR